MDFESITLRSEITDRGGGVEIDLSSLGYEGEKMSAFQGYLGGGMLGRVVHDCTIEGHRDDPKLKEIGMKLREYYFNLTNPEDGLWESVSFDQNQKMAVSAY